MTEKNNIYFASDFHLGLKVDLDPRIREKHVVRWLEEISPTAKSIHLVGDVFDFWWEYKKVVPRGFTRFLGKISQITDSGTEIHFYPGNHDMWIRDYLEEECGMIIHTDPYYSDIDGKKFFIVHGEGLGSKSWSLKTLMWLFKNKFVRAGFSFLHPSLAVSIGHRWSRSNRLGKHYFTEFLGEENEDLFRYAREVLKTKEVNFFIFGHRHLAIDKELEKDTRIIILGNWFNAPCYAKWDTSSLELVEFNYN